MGETDVCAINIFTTFQLWVQNVKSVIRDLPEDISSNLLLNQSFKVASD